MLDNWIDAELLMFYPLSLCQKGKNKQSVSVGPDERSLTSALH